MRFQFCFRNQSQRCSDDGIVALTMMLAKPFLVHLFDNTNFARPVLPCSEMEYRGVDNYAVQIEDNTAQSHGIVSNSVVIDFSPEVPIEAEHRDRPQYVP